MQYYHLKHYEHLRNALPEPDRKYIEGMERILQSVETMSADALCDSDDETLSLRERMEAEHAAEVLDECVMKIKQDINNIAIALIDTCDEIEDNYGKDTATEEDSSNTFGRKVLIHPTEYEISAAKNEGRPLPLPKPGYLTGDAKDFLGEKYLSVIEDDGRIVLWVPENTVERIPGNPKETNEN